MTDQDSITRGPLRERKYISINNACYLLWAPHTPSVMWLSEHFNVSKKGTRKYYKKQH